MSECLAVCVGLSQDVLDRKAFAAFNANEHGYLQLHEADMSHFGELELRRALAEQARG